MKTRQKFLSALLSLTVTLGTLSAWYFQTDFTSQPANWVIDYYYGRSGIIPTPDASTHTFTAGGLQLDGRVYTGAPNDFNTFWSGLNVKWNTEFAASNTQPFGVMLHRTTARVDGRGSQVNTWQFAGLTLWMVQENDISNNFDVHNEVVMFYEINQCNVPFSKFGLFRGTPQNFDMGVLERPTGGTLNMTNTGIFSWEWNHDDDNGGGLNPNHLGIKMTHDGSWIRLYLNPDPIDANAYPNEYCLAGEVQVSFSNRIKIMIGQEVNMGYTDFENAVYSNFLVRSAAIESSGSLWRNDRKPSELQLAFRFDSSSAGIGEIIFQNKANPELKPDIIRLAGEFGDSSNNGVSAPFTIKEDSACPRAGEASLFFRPVEKVWVLRFYKGNKYFTGRPAQVINHHTLIKKIELKIKNFSRDAWTVKYDNRMYDGDIDRSFSTTGPAEVNIIENEINTLGMGYGRKQK